MRRGAIKLSEDFGDSTVLELGEEGTHIDDGFCDGAL